MTIKELTETINNYDDIEVYFLLALVDIIRTIFIQIIANWWTTTTN